MSGILESRERLVNGRYYVLKDKKEDKLSSEMLGENDEDIKDRVVVTSCYSALSVSSNERTASKWAGVVVEGVAS